MPPPGDDPLAPLNELVGSWTLEATHPAFPTTVVGGQADFEWLKGERFLLQRVGAGNSDCGVCVGSCLGFAV